VTRCSSFPDSCLCLRTLCMSIQAAGTFADVMSGVGIREPSSFKGEDDDDEDKGASAKGLRIRSERRNLLRSMMEDRAAIDASLAATQHEGIGGTETPAVTPISPSAAGAGDAGLASTPVAPVLVTPALSTTAAPVPSSGTSKGGGPATALVGEKLIQLEDRDIGAVPVGVYGRYLSATGACTLPVILVSLVLSTVAGLLTDLWLSAWSSGACLVRRVRFLAVIVHAFLLSLPSCVPPPPPSRTPHTTIAPPDRGGYALNTYILVYGVLTAAASLLALCNALSWAAGGVNAGRVLHSAMLRRVLRAPMSFFDTTPAGRIINRFTSDVSTVDATLPSSFSGFLTMSLRILGTIALQAAVLPWVLIGVALSGAIAGYVVTMFRR
jgi:hypothetical protein